jgi:hypothetical protein
MLGKTLSVYGSLLAFNIFFLFFGSLSQIKLVNTNSNSFINVIFSVILIIGAALAANTGAELICEVLAGGKGAPTSGFAQAATRTMILARGASRIGRTILTGRGGGKGGKGGGSQSHIGGLIGAGFKTASAVATIAGGRNYTDMKNNSHNQYQNLKNILRGRPTTEGFQPGALAMRAQQFMDKGGLLGNKNTFQKDFERDSKNLTTGDKK